MELYKLKLNDFRFNFYARDAQDIVDLVNRYYQQSVNDGSINHPNIGPWVKETNLDDIEVVKQGLIRYHVGMLDLSIEGDIFSERMQVTDDFEVAVSPEALFAYAIQRLELPNNKRLNLYKFQVPHDGFGSLNFVPQDVMERMVNYDLTPHLENAKKARAKIEKIKLGHPNLI